jgi:hypothetical protein
MKLKIKSKTQQGKGITKSKESALMIEDLAKNLESPFHGNARKANIRGFGDLIQSSAFSAFSAVKR